MDDNGKSWVWSSEKSRLLRFAVRCLLHRYAGTGCNVMPLLAAFQIAVEVKRFDRDVSTSRFLFISDQKFSSPFVWTRPSRMHRHDPGVVDEILFELGRIQSRFCRIQPRFCVDSRRSGVSLNLESKQTERSGSGHGTLQFLRGKLDTTSPMGRPA